MGKCLRRIAPTALGSLWDAFRAQGSPRGAKGPLGPGSPMGGVTKIKSLLGKSDEDEKNESKL